MSTFAFLPRSVKKRKTETTPVQHQVSVSVASISTPAGPPIESEGHSSENTRAVISKGKEKSGISQGNTQAGPSNSSSKGPDLEDLARLVWLSLSDYALWSDADLRRKIDWSSSAQADHEEDAIDSQNRDDDGGYIPLSYLMKKSPVFLQAASLPSLAGQPETAYVKAIRSHASQLLDVRLILNDEEPPSFGASTWSTQTSSAGYEIRRKPSETRLSGYGKIDWHNLTIYVENIPIQFRNICGVSKFISSLFSSTENDLPKVQNVTFPPHHNDRPGALPTCKGFALVTLSSPEDVRHLLDEWSWDQAAVKSEVKDRNSEEDDIWKREAVKFGLRCLSKGRWEDLRAEYLLYRQQLVAELEAENEAQEKLNQSIQAVLHQPRDDRQTQTREERQDTRPQAAEVAPPKPGRNVLHPNSPFPPECLVFVRNVHPETNKTTLRTLFSQASKSTAGQAPASDGLDYVDYTKSLDSCYLRFSSPSQASLFVQYFTSNPISQTSGLDGDGKPPTSASDPQPAEAAVTPELVTGKREELYWQKIPEKVRRQAVEKALKVVQGTGEPGDGGTAPVNEGYGKKRRRGE